MEACGANRLLASLCLRVLQFHAHRPLEDYHHDGIDLQRTSLQVVTMMALTCKEHLCKLSNSCVQYDVATGLHGHTQADVVNAIIVRMTVVLYSICGRNA
jgi:hypothetical protein